MITRKITLILSVLILMAGMTYASESQAPKPYDVGSTIEAFSLKDQTGKIHDLSKVLGKKVIVLSFWSCQCPISIAYEERLKDLHKANAKNDVVVYAIDSNTTNDLEKIKAYAKKNELPYPVLKDWKNVIADKFNAQVTPEIFIIGKDKKVQYHGAFDDHKTPDRVKVSYAKNALKSVLDGDDVDIKKQSAFGCAIKRVKK